MGTGWLAAVNAVMDSRDSISLQDCRGPSCCLRCERESGWMLGPT